MGIYLRYLRPGRVLEASLGGVALVMFAVFAGQWVNASPAWSRAFTFSGPALAIAIIAYGYAASTLPVWLLLAPRDYLSAFIKVGAIARAGGRRNPGAPHDSKCRRSRDSSMATAPYSPAKYFRSASSRLHAARSAVSTR